MAEALIERRRFRTRADAGTQLRAGLVDPIGGGGAPVSKVWPVLDRIDAAAERKVEALPA